MLLNQIKQKYLTYFTFVDCFSFDVREINNLILSSLFAINGNSTKVPMLHVCNMLFLVYLTELNFSNKNKFLSLNLKSNELVNFILIGTNGYCHVILTIAYCIVQSINFIL